GYLCHTGGMSPSARPARRWAGRRDHGRLPPARLEVRPDERPSRDGGGGHRRLSRASFRDRNDPRCVTGNVLGRGRRRDSLQRLVCSVVQRILLIVPERDGLPPADRSVLLKVLNDNGYAARSSPLGGLSEGMDAICNAFGGRPPHLLLVDLTAPVSINAG